MKIRSREERSAAAKRGWQKMTPEKKAERAEKISKANTGRDVPDELRQQLSKAIKNIWSNKTPEEIVAHAETTKKSMANMPQDKKMSRQKKISITSKKRWDALTKDKKVEFLNKAMSGYKQYLNNLSDDERGIRTNMLATNLETIRKNETDEQKERRLKNMKKGVQEYWDNLSVDKRKMHSERISAGQKKRWNNTSNDRRKEIKLKIAISHENQQYIISSIERLVANELDNRNEYYVQQRRVSWYFADFYLPQHNLIIECDGDYWHSRPEVIIRDAKKNKCFLAHGFNLVRLTETEIRKDVRSAVSRALNLQSL